MAQSGSGGPVIRLVDRGDRIVVYRLIFRPWVTLRNGKRIYARSYGKKAFPIWVKVAVIRKAA